MVEAKEGEVAAGDVVVCVSSTEELVDSGAAPYCDLETKTRSRLCNYLYGPYRQHQVLVDCVLRLKKGNHCQGEDVPGRMLHVGPTFLGHPADSVVAQLLWCLALVLPFVFIVLGEVCEGTVMLCCCAIFLCVLVSCHSIAIFFILHNQKICKRFWFINKVSLDHYCGRENKVMEVTLENTMALPSLSAGQKSQVIARLARTNDKKGVMMMCTRSFWTNRILDPLLCLLFVLILSLVGLIVSIDLLRRLHF